MPQPKTLLIARSNYRVDPTKIDATEFAFPWFDEVISKAGGLGYTTTDLARENDTRDNFEDSIAYDDPLFVTGVGHGGYNIYTGQNTEPLLISGENDNLMADRVVYLLSCRVGARLGRTIMEKGGIAFLGYKQDYVLCGQEPGDEYSHSFAECSNAIINALLEGKTPDEAYNAALDKYDEWIEYWRASPSPYAGEMIKWLLWDRAYLVNYPTMLAPTPSILPLLAMGLIPVWLFKK